MKTRNCRKISAILLVASTLWIISCKDESLDIYEVSTNIDVPETIKNNTEAKLNFEINSIAPLFYIKLYDLNSQSVLSDLDNSHFGDTTDYQFTVLYTPVTTGKKKLELRVMTKSTKERSLIHRYPFEIQVME